MTQHAATSPFSCPLDGSIPTLCRALRLLICVVCLSIAPSFATLAQTNAPAPLPHAAQEALNKGIIAAKVPDYLLAIRFFQDARKLAPAAPVILLNLGIAESKIPGRELRAIAWFGAYLAANPDAPNAAVVKTEIAALDVRNQSNVSRLIKTAQDAAHQISHQEMWKVARLWAEFGDMNAALNTVKLMKNDDIYRSAAQESIAGIQAAAGDIAGALQTADLITRPDNKSGTLRFVGEIQLASNDIAGAQKTLALAVKTAERIDNLQTKGYKMKDIAIAQAEAGDIAGAQKSVAFIQGSRVEISKAAAPLQRLLRDENFKSEAMAQRAVAKAQRKAGDIAGARKTLTDAQTSADSIQAAGLLSKPDEQYAVAHAQIEAGDIAGAQKSADLAQKSAALIKDTPAISSWKTVKKKALQEAIAEAQAKVGVAAVPSSTRQSAPDTKPSIKPVTVSDWIKELEGDLNTGPFLDFAGYLKSLPSSDDPRKVFDGLHKTAETIVAAQNVIHKRLKQQAAR